MSVGPISRAPITAVERALSAAAPSGVRAEVLHTGPAHYLHSPGMFQGGAEVPAAEVRFREASPSCDAVRRLGGGSGGMATLMRDRAGELWVVKGDGTGPKRARRRDPSQVTPRRRC